MKKLKAKKWTPKTSCALCGHQRGRHNDNLCSVKACHCSGYVAKHTTTQLPTPTIDEAEPIDEGL